MAYIFRKRIEPRCVYCSKSGDLGNDKIICAKRGIMDAYASCRHFKYDPLKRVPSKPVRLAGGYTAEDLSL